MPRRANLLIPVCISLNELFSTYLYLYISKPQRRLASNDLGASGELVSGKSLSSCHNFPAWPLLFVLPTREVQLHGIVQFAPWIMFFIQNYFTTASCSSLINQEVQVESSLTLALRSANPWSTTSRYCTICSLNDLFHTKLLHNCQLLFANNPSSTSRKQSTRQHVLRNNVLHTCITSTERSTKHCTICSLLSPPLVGGAEVEIQQAALLL